MRALARLHGTRFSWHQTTSSSLGHLNVWCTHLTPYALVYLTSYTPSYLALHRDRRTYFPCRAISIYDISRVQFNSGRWTVAEHQGFLRGMEVYGSGNWAAIGVFVPTRSPLQIEEHAREHSAEVESVHREEVRNLLPTVFWLGSA